MKLKPSCGRRRVDSLSEGNKADTQCGHLVECHYQVPQVSTQTIQTPADKDVEASSAGISD